MFVRFQYPHKFKVFKCFEFTCIVLKWSRIKCRSDIKIFFCYIGSYKGVAHDIRH